MPPAAVEPVASPSGKPRARISGMPILPIATQVAGEEPLNAAKIELVAVRFVRNVDPNSCLPQDAVATAKRNWCGNK